jgi:hypothetical protein
MVCVNDQNLSFSLIHYQLQNKLMSRYSLDITNKIVPYFFFVLYIFNSKKKVLFLRLHFIKKGQICWHFVKIFVINLYTCIYNIVNRCKVFLFALRSINDLEIYK